MNSPKANSATQQQHLPPHWWMGFWIYWITLTSVTVAIAGGSALALGNQNRPEKLALWISLENGCSALVAIGAIVSCQQIIRRAPAIHTMIAVASTFGVLVGIIVPSALLLVQLLIGSIVGATVSRPWGDVGTRLMIEQFPYWLTRGLQLFVVGYAMAYFARHRDRELALSQMRTRLTEARLQLLTSQLQPHFLFNTFNSISALMHEDVQAADRMLCRLGDLLRLALRQSNSPRVSLAEELEALDLYVSIEQLRHGEQLRMQFDVDPAARTAMVPHLLLQPLVENAIRHGIAPGQQPGLISIRAIVEEQELHIQIRDDGVGLPPGWDWKQAGVGLSNTLERIGQFYGTRADLRLERLPNRGTLQSLRLPLLSDA